MGYEGARKKFHKKNLPISADLNREVISINIKLGDLRRLTNLIPDFAKEASKYRGKRQLAMIGMGLAGFLFGNLISSDGNTDRMDDLEKQFNLFTKNYIDFEEKQIEVNKELISQMAKMSKKINQFESNDRKYKVLEKGKATINSLISFLKESIDRVTQLIKGAINREVGTIIEFPEKIAGAIKKVEENSRSKAYIKNL